MNSRNWYLPLTTVPFVLVGFTFGVIACSLPTLSGPKSLSLTLGIFLPWEQMKSKVSFLWQIAVLLHHMRDMWHPSIVVGNFIRERSCFPASFISNSVVSPWNIIRSNLCSSWIRECLLCCTIRDSGQFSLSKRMSDYCLQGIQPCKCKGKGIDWLVIRSLH